MEYFVQDCQKKNVLLIFISKCTESQKKNDQILVEMSKNSS